MCATVQLFHSDGCLVPTVVTFRTPFEVVTSVQIIYLDKNFKKWIMWRSSAGLAPCSQRLIWTFTSSQSPPSFSGFSMASSSSWPSTQLDDQPSSSMFCLSFSRQHQDMREEEQLIKQAKSELLVSSQFIWSNHCNISSKIIFLVILDWPLHETHFSIGQICKINWSAALTEFSVPR